MRGTGRPSAAYIRFELAQVGLALRAIRAEAKPAAELTVADVRQLVATAADKGGNARGRFGALSRFLDWCHDIGHIQANPCTMLPRMRRPRAPEPRSHYLVPPDLARLWHAAKALREPVWRDLARFLIAVPCRRGEAVRLEWPHVNLERAEWRQPGRLTKNGEPHRLHLHPLAIDILRARQAVTLGEINDADRSTLVFPAPRSGRVLQTFSDLKAALLAATEEQSADALPNWTWHDFRRSFATALGEAGIPEPVADAILNHRQAATRAGVLGTYQRASRWPAQRQAMELWGKMLASSIAEHSPPSQRDNSDAS